MTPPQNHQILGINFFGGTSREAVEEITRRGGLLSAPAAPSMISLCRDPEYRQALLSAEIAIADSGFMVLLWKFFTGESIPRISGLEHVKRLLEHESMCEPGAVLWVVATEASRAKLVGYLEEKDEGRRMKDERGRLKAESGNLKALTGPSVSPSPSTSSFILHPSSFIIHVAPRYARPVVDEPLLALVREKRPRHVVIAVGGGIQDQLGQYLLAQLDYRPAVHCIGAALGFITGDQVRIPDWADRYYLGWFFRSLAQPTVFIPRFWSARRLPWLIWKYRERMPPMEN